MSAHSPQSIPQLSRHWIGRLAHYRRHRNDEHREALVHEALRFAGMRLESQLAASPFWSDAPLARRAAVLLYLVDRGAVIRGVRHGRVSYEPTVGAEHWVASQTSLAPYLVPTLEFLEALRHDRRHSQSAAE